MSRRRRYPDRTPDEVREDLYRLVWRTGGWVPLAAIVGRMVELGCSVTAGEAHLRTLVLTGRLVREHAPGMRSYRYRVPTIPRSAP